MSVLPQLERDLLEAARRTQAARGARAGEDADRPARSGSRLGGSGRARRMRVAALAVICLLAITTIGLAASGTILKGSPVRPEELLNPHVGEGVPAPGASRLVALRVADPEGGLPWGMRIVRTTRGEVCMQVGRVENGQLGELGIDGAFHDDGRFHPIPADALPADVFHGEVFNSPGMASGNASCQLIGEASANEHVGLDRSAASNPSDSTHPLRELRDISYGILGREAVSVNYKDGAQSRSAAVVPGIGSYLIVQPVTAGQQIATGGGSLGSEGDLAPYPPLTAITYRLGGRLCQRGPAVPPGAVQHLADPCPWPHFPAGSPRTQDLHRPLHVRLQISHHLITGAVVSFTAPFAVTSARADYLIEVPSAPCNRSTSGYGRSQVGGYASASIGRDVAQGETVSHRLSDLSLFVGVCGRPGEMRSFTRHSATIDVRYERTGEASVLVGSITVHEPVGTRPAHVRARRTGHRAR